MWLQVEGQEEQLVAVLLPCSCVGLHIYRHHQHLLKDFCTDAPGCVKKNAQTSTVA